MQIIQNHYPEIVQGLTMLLMVAGLWRIFQKCGQAGWWALIPGFHYYKLGECAGRETDGKTCLVFEILLLAMDTVLRFAPVDGRTADYFTVISLVCVIILAVFQIRVLAGICRTFGRTKFWIFAWVFAGWAAALIWGFSEKFRPVNLGRYNDDDHLPGTQAAVYGPMPADIPPVEPSMEGLAIQLNSRTVNDFATKRYLLKDIRLNIPNGSLVLLLVGSGSGKTTLVNAVTGYEKADATMLLNGEDIYQNYSDMKYRIGFVPQQELLRMNDTVIGTLNDAADLRLPVQVTPEESRRRVAEVMEILGLTAGSTGLVAKKSGGQKKRISIGMELISDPELFILDEPDSGLDGVMARELFEKLRQVADAGNIVIAITHTPDRVADLFDRVIVLARDSGRVGRLAFYGTPDDARDFFGKNSMEEIVMSINRKEEGGEGRADEFIAAYPSWAAHEALRDAAGKQAGPGEAPEGKEDGDEK